DHVVAIPPMVANEEPMAADGDSSALGQSGERPNDWVAAIVVDEHKCLSGGGRRPQGAGQGRTVESDRTGDVQLVSSGAVESDAESRARAERQVATGQNGRRGAEADAATRVDRDRSSHGPGPT